MRMTLAYVYRFSYNFVMDERIMQIKNRIQSGFFTTDPSIRESLIRICDKAEQCLKNNVQTHTGFLNETSGQIADSVLGYIPEVQYIITGGYNDAERKIILFSPPETDTPDIPISLLRISYSGPDPLTHRDILGSLMSLGIKQDCIGDILPSDHSADVLVLREVASYLQGNAERIGKHRCRCEEIPIKMLRVPERRVKTIRDTVASLRLDSILAAAFDLPRGTAAEMIKSGKVTMNGREASRCADTVNPDTTISCRGYGKCRFLCSEGLSRKGRIRVTLEKYL